MGEIIDFHSFYRKKYPLKTFGLSERQVDVCLTCLGALCDMNPNVNPNFFDPEQDLKLLLDGDAKKFEKMFCGVIRTIDLYSELSDEEIPIGKEFEVFPTFLDFMEFVMIKSDQKYC
ncbi:hypothetical protein FZW96_00030 [Bacillus sp. BGMRC 2118]|nr:hypothetical protein FZW96_00030 [Bacillus sp. BGMRC 2118]